MKGYYVYTHTTADTGEIFYIGVGTKRRAWDFLNRNEVWKSLYNNHGCIVSIVHEGFEEKYEAVSIEVELQKKHLPKACLQYGDGKYTILTEETRKRYSERSKGKRNPMYGKSHSDSAKNKMSLKKKGKKGRKQNDWEIKALIKRNQKSIINCRGQVFNSLKEAYPHFGLESHTSISQCLNGKQKSAGKYPDGNKVKWNYLKGEE